MWKQNQIPNGSSILSLQHLPYPILLDYTSGPFCIPCFFTSGRRPIPWAINSEIYSLWTRNAGNACSSVINWIFNIQVSLTFLHTADYLTYCVRQGRNQCLYQNRSGNQDEEKLRNCPRVQLGLFCDFHTHTSTRSQGLPLTDTFRRASQMTWYYLLIISQV